MLLFCSSLVAQIYNSQIESNLLHDLNNFALTQKTDTSYHFINTYFFKEILKKVNPKNIPVLFEPDSLNKNIQIELSINSSDSSFSYHYSKYFNGNSEYYYNCGPSRETESFENNLLYGCTSVRNTIKKDTINNIIITKPTHTKYRVMVCMCPHSPSKKDVTDDFLKELKGQYQLIIYKFNGAVTAYFIAPPKIIKKPRIKYIHTKF